MRVWKIFVAMIATVSVALPGAAIAAGPETGTVVGTLSVVGRGEVSRAPDLATVDAAITTNDNAASRALSENNRRFAALLVKLEALDVRSSDIISTSLQSSFNPRPTGNTANFGGQLYGFIVTRSVHINVNVLGQAGAVVDAATAAGASDINGVSYGFRDRPAVERAALAAAVADAFAQAQTIAAAAHVAIVRIVRIGNESGPMMPEPAMRPMAMQARAETPAPTTIAPSDLQVVSTIAITYSIR